MAAMLPQTDFVWAFLDRTAREYARKARTCEFLPVGCVDLVPARLRRAPKDIDVVFFGRRTPHRAQVIAAAGIRVAGVGAGVRARLVAGVAA